MDSIQITLAIAAVTIAAAVTFSKAKADVIRLDSASLSAATFAVEQLPAGKFPFVEHGSVVSQGVRVEFRD